jgi:hypothetical protein
MIGLAFVLGSILILLLIGLVTLRELGRNDVAFSDAVHFSMAVKYFDLDHGRYPNSISELTASSDFKAVIEEIIKKHTDFTYANSNSFYVIDVLGCHFTGESISTGIRIKGKYATNDIAVTR